MLNNGWIKIHRQMLDWEWYNNTNCVRLFLHILLKANYEEKRWQGVVIKRGQFITSRLNLSEETTLTVQQVRTSLNYLKSTSEITIETTNKYTKISVVNYEKYQINDQEDNQQDNKQITNEQPSNNHQITTTKEVKEVKKERKEENNSNELVHNISEIELPKNYTDTGYSNTAKDLFDVVWNYWLPTKRRNYNLDKKAFYDKVDTYSNETLINFMAGFIGYLKELSADETEHKYIKSFSKEGTGFLDCWENYIGNGKEDVKTNDFNNELEILKGNLINE